jgi:hypothetical protein
MVIGATGTETLVQMGQDPSGGLPAAVVARAYLSSVQHEVNGTVIDARRFA